MVRSWCLVITFGLVTGVSVASPAQGIVGTAGASFQRWSPADLNNNAAPYWDNYSGEGQFANIGYCLSGGPECVLYDGPPGAIPFWGNVYDQNRDSGGSSDLNFYFAGALPPGYKATLEGEYAGAIGEFGWFETNSTGSILGTQHPLFTFTDTIGTVRNFTPTPFYGYYYSFFGNTFYTISRFNTVRQDQQRFAVFEPTPGAILCTVWIGLDDTPDSDGDYNDMIVSIAPRRP